MSKTKNNKKNNFLMKYFEHQLLSTCPSFNLAPSFDYLPHLLTCPVLRLAPQLLTRVWLEGGADWS